MVNEVNSKKIILSLIISLLVVQLSIPAYAPARRPDYIDYMPVVPVADVILSYENINIRSITGSGFGGISEVPNERNIVIDCIGYGFADFVLLDTGATRTALFVQNFELIVTVDESARTGRSYDARGKTNIAFFVPDVPSDQSGMMFEGRFEGNLQTAGDDAQLFMIDLQSILVSTGTYSKDVASNPLKDITDGTSNTFYLKLDTNGLLNKISENITINLESNGQILHKTDKTTQLELN
jgi:hypothetical protein